MGRNLKIEEKMKTGILIFSTDLIDRDKDEIADVLSQIKFLPYRVEHLLHMRSLEMIGYSHKFEEADEWSEPPRYDIEIIRSEDGEITVSAVRLEGKRGITVEEAGKTSSGNYSTCDSGCHNENSNQKLGPMLQLRAFSS
jgi:hypothetical protein